jgi:chloramphenicol-sensitive protein RarD
MAGLTSLLIAANWTLYVWAIGSGHSLDAALGYYINPLFSVFLGAMLLGEQLRLPQKLAIGLAAMAVAILTYRSSSFPAVALGLTASFGVYSYLKKSLPVGPSEGFLLEVLILLTPASAYVVWLTLKGQSHFLIWDHIGDTFLLLGCGVVTTVPLICYAHGAKLLRLSTIGMMQYIAPTMVFVLAVFVFDEPIDAAYIMAFPIIWLALVIYTASMLQQGHAAASAAASVAAAANARKPSRA